MVNAVVPGYQEGVSSRPDSSISPGSRTALGIKEVLDWFSHLSVTEEGWFQDPPRVPKSEGAQAASMKWRLFAYDVHPLPLTVTHP